MARRVTVGRLAARWSELLIADVEPWERLTAAAAETGSLLRPGATQEQVREAEARLGRELPPSYREFLLASNGAYGDLCGATTVWDDRDECPPMESDVVGVALLPVEDLRWLRDADPWYAQFLSEQTWGGPPRPVRKDGDDPDCWTPAADGLVIATDKAPGTTLLVPFPGRVEWQVWHLWKDGVEGYRSFRSFLEYQILLREPVMTVTEVADLVAAGRAGDHLAVMRLSRVVHPDAVSLLAAVLDDRRFGVQPAVGLGRIGTPRAIECLARARSDVAWHGLRLAAFTSEQARDVLVERGDFRTLCYSGDPRAFQLAARQVADLVGEVGRERDMDEAITILGRGPDHRYVPMLLPLLRHPDLDTQAAAARALANLGIPEGEEHLALLADMPDDR